MACACQKSRVNSVVPKVKRTITRPSAPIRNGSAGRRRIDRRVLK